VGLQSNYTCWNDGNLRYLAFVSNMREVKGNSESNNDITTYDISFNYGPFAASVIVLHGSGNPIDVHHVIALNGYLDEAYVTKAAISKKEFMKFWAEYKIRVRGSVSSVPSPYKWEKPQVKDKLGAFNPTLVQDTISRQIKDIWLAVSSGINSFRCDDE
jgi:hypothetical protein